MLLQARTDMLTTTMKPKHLILALALIPFGCGQGAGAPPAGAPAVAPTPTSASLPAAPAPAAPASAGSASSGSGAAPSSAAPAAPSSRVRMIVPAGTELPIEMETTVSTDSSREGDRVTATLTKPVALRGFTLDQGAEVRGQVVTVVPAKRVKGRARLVLAFDSVMENGEKLSIDTEPLDFSAKSTSGKDKKIIAGGAIGGLIVGALKDGK